MCWRVPPPFSQIMEMGSKHTHFQGLLQMCGVGGCGGCVLQILGEKKVQKGKETLTRVIFE